MLVKVKVVRLSDGQVPGVGLAALRYLPNALLMLAFNCCGVLSLIVGIGIYIWALVALFSQVQRRTPFDLAAKTIVIDVS